MQTELGMKVDYITDLVDVTSGRAIQRFQGTAEMHKYFTLDSE